MKTLTETVMENIFCINNDRESIVLKGHEITTQCHPIDFHTEFKVRSGDDAKWFDTLEESIDYINELEA